MIKAWIQTLVKSKTMIFALLLVGLSTAQASLELFQLSPRATGIAGIILAVIVAILRLATTSSIQDIVAIQQVVNEDKANGVT